MLLGGSAVGRADRCYKAAESCREIGVKGIKGTGQGSSADTEWEDTFQRLLGRQRWRHHQGMELKTNMSWLTQDTVPVFTWSEGWIARGGHQHSQGVVRKEPRVEI